MSQGLESKTLYHKIEDIRKIFHDAGFSDVLGDSATTAKETEAKINKRDYTKLKCSLQ